MCWFFSLNVCHASFFFFAQAKINVLLLAASLSLSLSLSTSHLIRPPLSPSAVLPGGGTGCYCCYGNRWLCPFHKNKLFMLLKKSPCHTSAAEHLKKTTQNIRTDTLGNSGPLCSYSMFLHSGLYINTVFKTGDERRFTWTGERDFTWM